MKSVTRKSLFQALAQLKQLMAKYDIGINDWALAVHYAYFLRGYNIPYQRGRHLNILVKAKKLPWRDRNSSRLFAESSPPISSQFAKDAHAFFNKTGFDFDIILVPEAKKTFITKQSTNFKINNQNSVRVLTVAGDLLLEEQIFKIFAKHSPEKLQRIIDTYYLDFHAKAAERKDQETLKKLDKLINKYYIPAQLRQQAEAERLTQFKKNKILIGQPATTGLARGQVLLVKQGKVPKHNLKKYILVASMTSPSLMGAIIKASALVTDEGGALCHAAITARELKIPCVIGTKIATRVLKNGDLVEVDANRGIVKKL